ncbi:hypothetical protein [Membranihabitans maritimus]|uniref:hypothetical protein n=1 Tax=Membranihabitans maritimus TaxID=2904244 RepID=UPI001F39688B|nr:hypothetical protein [Membranihabitans maritimus]
MKALILEIIILIFLSFTSCKQKSKENPVLSESKLDNPEPFYLSNIADTSYYITIDTVGGNYINSIRKIYSLDKDLLIVDNNLSSTNSYRFRGNGRRINKAAS